MPDTDPSSTTREFADAGCRPREGRRFAGFVLTGGIAAGVNLAARWIFNFAMPYPLAIAVAYLIGMTTAFLLARRFVFRNSGRRWREQYVRFTIVNLFSFLAVLGVSLVLARAVFPSIGLRWHPDDIAHLIGVLSPVVLSYYAHKHFSFGTKQAAHG